MTNSPDRTYAGGDYTDGRLSAPAAERNGAEVAAALARIAPATGHALEIASGTGQHVVRFARAMPGLTWQPTDPAPERRASIAAWTAAEPAPNILPPLDLDACAPGWSQTFSPVDMVFVANLLHLISEPQAEILLTEIAAVLASGGIVALYGPYLRAGQTTSDGDAAFHTSLQRDLPGAGYKDCDQVIATLVRHGLAPLPRLEMQANNLILRAQKPRRPS